MVRLASGIVLGAAAVAAIRFLPIDALRVLAVVVAALAAHEYLQIAGTAALARQAVPIAATMLLCALVACEVPIDSAALVLVALAWIATDLLATGRPLPQAAADLVAPIYIGAPLGSLVVVQVKGGWQATLLLVALVIVSDSAQYYCGRMFGRHPLAPSISPKKTIEGAVGGLVFGMAFMVLAGSRLLPAASLLSVAALGAAIVVLGICGDLFESRLKRLAGMKDSSSLIPGHGGVLDRIDALLFAAPAFYVYLRSTLTL
ncbi:MAG TPA: phosphatidate cytidylyltransferase [Vicinamibacterales bacterium]|nr:phosphatidate cytidylyltransferase [Vicinamibacterales bacterium]